MVEKKRRSGKKSTHNHASHSIVNKFDVRISQILITHSFTFLFMRKDENKQTTAINLNYTFSVLFFLFSETTFYQFSTFTYSTYFFFSHASLIFFPESNKKKILKLNHNNLRVWIVNFLYSSCANLFCICMQKRKTNNIIVIIIIIEVKWTKNGIPFSHPHFTIYLFIHHK